ncbi:MAG: HdeD family acid-resistance protein [Bacilli bacterium]
MAAQFKKSIENIYNKMIVFSIITSIITIIVGTILLFLPDLTNKVVGIITGVIFVLFGLTSVYKYLKRDGAKIYTLNLVFSILYLVLGVVIIIFPFSVIEFVTVCLGLFLIINGATKINYGLWLKRGSCSAWLITLIAGSFLGVLGIMMIFNPFTSYALTQIVGAFLIMSGVINLSDAITFKAAAKEIMEIFW